MNIDLHILCYNESDVIRLVLRHYKKFCRHLFVYDNHSTDNSRQIAEEEGAIVHLFGTKFFDDQVNMDTKNSCWKGSDADFVIVCDMDEVLFCDPKDIELHSTLHGTQSHVFKPQGWQIMSDLMPVNDLLEITNGYRFDNYSKCILFDPWLKAMNFNLGAHKCSPVSPNGIEVEVSEFTSSMYVLHYKHIGGLQRTIDRYKEYKPRMSPFNRKHGHGKHYNRSVASLKQEWEERMKISKPLI